MRMVRTLRAELGTEHGTVKRVPTSSATGWSRCGCGCARPTSTTATRPGVTTDEAARVRELEQEIRELRRANEILKRAATFFGAELDRQYRR